ncbi:topology modulation protein [Novosphingobium olei]|uniref:topology modulation protein n=1 Tax=Novosphingobium olei TaxID=2728851 RepID=UPI00309367F7|nr:topology modulation protein [Novosphingobium olei]
MAKRTGLPLVHLDFHYWRPGWVPSEKTLWREKVISLAAEPRWIIDGNYGNTIDIRAAHADTLIHLDFPTSLCFARVIYRTIANHGRERTNEVMVGCPERFDTDFFRFVLNYRRRNRERDMEKLRDFTGNRFTFTKPKDLMKFIEGF